MLNKIIIQGRLCSDVELRRTNNGTAVASVTLAVDRDFKSQDGSRETDFISVVAWRGVAECLAKYLTKGRMAIVDGRLQIRDWQDKDGNKRRSAEVVADNVYFGDSKKEYGGDYGGAPVGGYKAAGKAVDVEPGEGEFAEVEDDDSDLPF